MELIKSKEMVKSEMNEILTEDDLRTFAFLKEYEAKWNAIKSMKEQMLKDYMKTNGIKQFDSNEVRITYIEPSIRKTIDTKKMKEEGIYDFYTKESKVKDSVRIELKYDD